MTLERRFNDALRAETLRALDLIERTQLVLFRRDSEPAPAIARAAVEAALERSGSDESLALEAMRSLLRDTLTSYEDTYAAYIDPERYDKYSDRRAGRLVGVGIKYRARTDDYPIAIGVIDGGPLDGLSIEPGEQLLSIDGHDLRGATSVGISGRIKGEAGSFVELAFDGGSGRHRVRVARAEVKLAYARYEQLPDAVGYLRISRFGTDTHHHVRELLAAVQGANAIRGCVLDLRGNPGGSTRAARGIASIFSERAAVYCEQYKSGKVRRLPREGARRLDVALSVLVDERSMSSAEILAGALQFDGRARVVGAPTFGKGLIQKVEPLEAPLAGALRTTIATYTTPDGRPLHGRGILPDVYVPSAPYRLFDESGSLNVEPGSRATRRRLLAERLRARLPADEAEAWLALPDTQLAVAISVL